jgi:hypothetical protein
VIAKAAVFRRKVMQCFIVPPSSHTYSVNGSRPIISVEKFCRSQRPAQRPPKGAARGR